MFRGMNVIFFECYINVCSRNKRDFIHNNANYKSQQDITILQTLKTGNQIACIYLLVIRKAMLKLLLNVSKDMSVN